MWPSWCTTAAQNLPALKECLIKKLFLTAILWAIPPLWVLIQVFKNGGRNISGYLSKSPSGLNPFCGPYPHAQLDVLSSVDLHSRIQQTDLTKVLPIHHKGAANHSWSSAGAERESIFWILLFSHKTCINPQRTLKKQMQSKHLGVLWVFSESEWDNTSRISCSLSCVTAHSHDWSVQSTQCKYTDMLLF